MLLIKAGDPLTDVQWLLYLQDHGCHCILFDTSRCDTFRNVQLHYEHLLASSLVVLCN